MHQFQHLYLNFKISFIQSLKPQLEKSTPIISLQQSKMILAKKTKSTPIISLQQSKMILAKKTKLIPIISLQQSKMILEKKTMKNKISINKQGKEYDYILETIIPIIKPYNEDFDVWQSTSLKTMNSGKTLLILGGRFDTPSFISFITSFSIIDAINSIWKFMLILKKKESIKINSRNSFNSNKINFNQTIKNQDYEQDYFESINSKYYDIYFKQISRSQFESSSILNWISTIQYFKKDNINSKKLFDYKGVLVYLHTSNIVQNIVL